MSLGLVLDVLDESEKRYRVFTIITNMSYYSSSHTHEVEEFLALGNREWGTGKIK